METYKVYGVAFDRTLNLAEKYPQLGEPNMRLIDYLKERQQAGDKIILWTCREGDLLKSAVKYCKSYGLEFDAVNDNLRENIEHFNNNCRKVYANYYIDDRNMNFGNLSTAAPHKPRAEARMGIAECIVEEFCNLRENIERFNNNCRKVFADYYIDDRNMSFGNLPADAPPKPRAEKRMGIAEYIMERFGKIE